MAFRTHPRATIRNMSDVRLRHEWRQCHLAFDPMADEWPVFTDYELELHAELGARLERRPVQECVCEDCWPLLPQATG